MQKKAIKGKKTTTKKSKKINPKIKTQKKHNTSSKKIKQRVKPKFTKADRKAQIVCIGLILISIVIFYLIYGIELAAIAAGGTLFIVILTLLLRKVKNQKRKRKIINFLLIFTLTIGILAVIAFGSFLMYIKSVAEPRFKPNK